MKKILLISDNIYMFDQLRKIIDRNNDCSIEFNYACSDANSPVYKHEEFLLNNGIVVDVKSECSELIKSYNLIISAHCKKIFPAELVRSVQCINIHPGYNPINRGWYPQVFAIIYDLPVGATIHVMDNLLDHGEIICRKYVKKEIWDTSLSLYNKILKAEIELFEENYNDIINKTFVSYTPESEGYIFLKKDFQQLCKIDLDQQGTFFEFYNLLRAMSHDAYNNAYIIDPLTGKKIFLKLYLKFE